MTTDTLQTFAAKEIPAEMKALVKLTGKRPNRVKVVFMAGPAEVHYRWGSRPVCAPTTKLIHAEEVHGYDSAGESYTDRMERYSGPVAVETIGSYSGAKVQVTVYLGNLGELVPSVNGVVTPEQLALLWKAAHQSMPTPAKVELVTFVEPHPFSTVTELTETSRTLLSETKSEQVQFLEQLGLE